MGDAAARVAASVVLGGDERSAAPPSPQTVAALLRLPPGVIPEDDRAALRAPAVPAPTPPARAPRGAVFGHTQL